MERKEQVEALFRGLVEGKPYTKKIPLNRLSISGLAFSAEQEVKRKLGEKQETLKDKLNMFRGTALHNYVQSLVKDQGYTAEYRMYHSIPHRWHYMGFDRIDFAGVIDLLHDNLKEAIELKSSTSSDRIEEYHKIQLASYLKMLEEKTGKKYTGIVVKFGGSEVAAEEIPEEDVQRYWDIIVGRAIQVADRLDEEMEKRDILSIANGDKDGDSSSGLYRFDDSDKN